MYTDGALDPIECDMARHREKLGKTMG